jgi:hypothetical protein
MAGDSLRAFVHALLSKKVVYFPLIGFLFAALAGLGLGLILDNFDRKPKQHFLGWCLLIVCLPLWFAFTYLGLHT